MLLLFESLDQYESIQTLAAVQYFIKCVLFSCNVCILIGEKLIVNVRELFTW